MDVEKNPVTDANAANTKKVVCVRGSLLSVILLVGPQTDAK